MATEADTRATNLLEGAEKSSILIRGRVCPNIVKTRRAGRQPTPNSNIGAGHQPTLADAGNRPRVTAKPAGSGKEDTTPVFSRGEAARPTAIVFCCGLWQTGQKKNISVWRCPFGTSVECGEKLEPLLDARVEISYFADDLPLSRGC